MQNKLYIIKGKKKEITEYGLKLLIQDYNLGYSQLKIAKKFGVSDEIIRRWMKENNITIRKRKWNINENYFDTIDTPEKAYWLGFFSADGYVHQERGQLSLELQEIDKSHVQKFANALSCNIPLMEIKGNFNNKPWTHFRFSIKCRNLVNKMNFYGITQRKSLTFVPVNIPYNYFNYWILGYMDGDGCIFQAKNRIKISFTGTQDTLNLIKNFFNSNNQIILEHRCENTYKFTLEVDKSERFLKEIDYKNLPFCLERKQLHYSSLIQ